MVRKESADPKLAVSCGPHCRNTMMKLTKNAAALLLAASLAVSVCATPVFAADPKPTDSNAAGVQNAGAKVTTPATESKAWMELKYEVTEGYKWSIPANIDFGKDQGNEDNDIVINGSSTGNPKCTVTVSECKIKNGNTLYISMNGNGGGSGSTAGAFKLKDDNDQELLYQVHKVENPTNKSEVTAGADVVALGAGIAGTTTNLEFTLKTKLDSGKSEKAGSYVGYAIFTAQAQTTKVAP